MNNENKVLIDINNIQLINKDTLKKDDIIVYSIDVGTLPKHLYEQYCLKLKEAFSEQKIIIKPKEHELSIISKEDDEL